MGSGSWWRGLVVIDCWWKVGMIQEDFSADGRALEGDNR